MAKVVSTKFGDRGLVHLPPVNLSGKATPQVHTIAPAYKDSGGYTGPTSVVPKEYAYIPPAGRDPRNPWLGPPEKGYAQGNIVMPETNVDENGIGNHMFSQLLQQSNVQGYLNYNQGYPVVPAVSDVQQYMHYTPHAVSSIAPAQQPAVATQQVQGQNPQQYSQGPQGHPGQAMQQPQQYPGQPNPAFQSPPQEKHIFYGPDGEILPGPPPDFHHRWNGHGFRNSKLQDFIVEGHLHFGHLKSVRLMDPLQKFPVFPDYLLKDLKHKYGQYERTFVRIVSKSGEIHIYATPSMPGSQLIGGWPTQYVPVYIDEDEYFRNYPSRYSPGPYRVYGTPPPLGMGNRSYGINVPRPRTEDDPMAGLRWTKDDSSSRRASSAKPVERSHASFNR